MMTGSGDDRVPGFLHPSEVKMRSGSALPAVACRRGGSRVFRLLATAALLIAVGVTTAGGATTEAKAPSEYYVADTGHALAEPFLSAWAERDGMTTLGLPVSEPTNQSGHVDQYFEYGYLQTTSGSNRPDQIVLRRTGYELLAAERESDRSVAGRRVGGTSTGAAYFDSNPSTSPKLKGRTKSFYDRHGGVARFGRPISQSYLSYGMRIQWFEFGRLQWSLADKKVVAAPIGYELARLRGVDTSRVDGGKLPAFDARRFRTFHGDGTLPEASGPFSPVTIMIPSIAITAAIEQVAIVNGVMKVPENAWNVGWYSSLAKPGERTNVVMAGHKDWWGIGPVVFWNLDQVQPGDKIYLVGQDGKGSTYVVDRSWDVDANVDAGTIIGDTGGETLTLITCGGAFDGSEYLSRHIVQAERI
jgi:LPXTG-site transpeptidase (sortase) family protein